VDRWVQGIDDWVLMYGICVIQKEVAYFGCTAALGDSCAALAHVVLPSVFLPALLVLPHLRHAMVGVVD
jgi:hypothetical protein